MHGSLPIEAVRVDGFPFLVVRRNATLGDLREAAPRWVRERLPGHWEVKRTVVVTDGATLSVRSPRVRELRLRSSLGPYAALVAYDASLRFAGTRRSPLIVTSWDHLRDGPDRKLADGRALIEVVGRGRLDAADITFANLGYAGAAGALGRLSGVAAYAETGAVRERPTGTVVRSTFRHNYFGGYSHNAVAMVWSRNRFVHNVVYGFDPHTHSDRFLVEGNYAAHNGRHGIIFSRSCNYNVIRGNISELNGWHGIVIDDGNPNDGPSRNNWVIDNVVNDNRLIGISIDGSSHTVVRGNTVRGGRYGIRVLRRTTGTLIERNTVLRPRRYGLFVDGPDRAAAGWASAIIVRDNRFGGGIIGVRMNNVWNSTVNDNVVDGARRHALQVDGRRGRRTELMHNRLQGAGPSPVLLPQEWTHIRQRANSLKWNYPVAHDLARLVAWVIGPAVWVLILLGSLLGGLVGVVPSRRRRTPPAV